MLSVVVAHCKCFFILHCVSSLLRAVRCDSSLCDVAVRCRSLLIVVVVCLFVACWWLLQFGVAVCVLNLVLCVVVHSLRLFVIRCVSLLVVRCCVLLIVAVAC